MVEIAARNAWAERFDASGAPLFRTRPGRGAPTEYHHSQFPAEATLELVRRGLLEPSVCLSSDTQTGTDLTIVADKLPDSLWTWYDAQPASTRAKAAQRLEIIQAIEVAKQGGTKPSLAVSLVATRFNVSVSTIWPWLKAISGVPATDWLPTLAPRFAPGGVKADIDPGLWLIFKSDCLRASGAAYAACYDRLKRDFAEPRNITLPSLKTMVRRLRKEVPAHMITAKRRGMETAMTIVPPQQRSLAGMAAMDAINVDGHVFDVFVNFPARDGQAARRGRTMMVAMQDIYSRKIVGWRLGEAETAAQTILCFGDVFRAYGLPLHCLMDNGRAFAGKAVSGGAKTRFRGKIREDEPKGLLASLGIAIHWATPHHGQAKPIERAFRTLEEIISKHPLCDGAYTGHHIDAKPENYGKRAIDFDVFEKLVAVGIEVYNGQSGRQGGVAQGRSYNETFNESFDRQVPRHVDDVALRYLLLTMDEVRTNKNTGHIDFHGNRYWCPELNDVAGEKVTIRFDPDHLHQPIHIYRQTGEYVVTAPVREPVGFFAVQGAKDHAKNMADMRKSIRRAAELEGLISSARLAEMMRTIPEDFDIAPAPAITVVTPMLPAPRKLLTVVEPEPQEPRRESVIDRYTAAIEAQQASERPQFTVLDGGLSTQQEPERP